MQNTAHAEDAGSDEREAEIGTESGGGESSSSSSSSGGGGGGRKAVSVLKVEFRGRRYVLPLPRGDAGATAPATAGASFSASRVRMRESWTVGDVLEAFGERMKVRRLGELLTEDGAVLFAEDLVDAVLEDSAVVRVQAADGDTVAASAGAPAAPSPPRPAPASAPPPPPACTPAAAAAPRPAAADGRDGWSVEVRTIAGTRNLFCWRAAPSLADLRREVAARCGFDAQTHDCALFCASHPLLASEDDMQRDLAEGFGVENGEVLWALPVSRLPPAGATGSGSTTAVSRGWTDVFCIAPAWQPVQAAQGDRGMSTWLSHLYVLAGRLTEDADRDAVCAQLWHASAFPPAVLALRYLFARKPPARVLRTALASAAHAVMHHLWPTVDAGALFARSGDFWSVLLERADRARAAAAADGEGGGGGDDAAVVAEATAAQAVDLSCPLSGERLVDPVLVDVSPPDPPAPADAGARFQVFVRLMTGETATFDASRATPTSTLFAKIRVRAGYAPDAVLFATFGGRALRVGKTLADFDIGPESTVHLTSVSAPAAYALGTDSGVCVASRAAVLAAVTDGKPIGARVFEEVPPLAPARAVAHLLRAHATVAPAPREVLVLSRVARETPPALQPRIEPHPAPAATIAPARKCLSVVAPLSLRRASPPALTVWKDGSHAVFLSVPSSGVESVEIFCPALGIVKAEPESIDVEVSALNGLETPTRSYPAREAIVVLVDCSWSMSQQFMRGGPPDISSSSSSSAGGGRQQQQPYSRLAGARELFQAFANRTIAYALEHYVGLISVGSEATVQHALTANFDIFGRTVNRLEASGCTALYQAIDRAVDLLVQFRDRLSAETAGGSDGAGSGSGTGTAPFGDAASCRLRILALSDGDDTVGGAEPLAVANRLQDAGITFDAVRIGEEGKGKILRALTGYTGGYCFFPTDVTAGTKLFEAETFLSVRDRRPPEPFARVAKEADLTAYGSRPFDVTPPRADPAELTRPVSHPASVLATAASLAPPRSEDRPRLTSIIKEMHTILKNRHPAVDVFPCESAIDFWQILITGPAGTPYQGGCWLAYVVFPSDFPQKPPTVRFVTPICHCNINSAGRVCHSVLAQNWTSDTTMFTVFSHVYGLLLSPEPTNPLDTALASEWHTDRASYEARARAATRASASKTRAQWLVELGVQQADTLLEVPSYLKCGLTGNLLENPYATPAGHIYSRTPLLEHIRAHGTEPKTGAPLSEADIVPSIPLRQALADFRSRVELNHAWWATGTGE